jgi:hypothetical protein
VPPTLSAVEPAYRRRSTRHREDFIVFEFGILARRIVAGVLLAAAVLPLACSPGPGVERPPSELAKLNGPRV